MKLKRSSITMHDKVNRNGQLYIYIEDSYNGTGESTHIPRVEALEMIEHLIDVFDFNAAERFFGVEVPN